MSTEIDPALADALPMDDPLRGELGLSMADEDPLRDRLRDLDLPEPGQLAPPLPPAIGGPSWRVSALAAAVTLAAGLVLGWLVFAPSPTPEPEPRADSADSADTPRVLALRFWHDTCPACREIGPRYDTVSSEFATGSILFVTFDMTTGESRQQAKLLASALGLADLYEDRFGDTGYVLLVDVETREVLGELTTADSLASMRRRLAAAVE